MNELSQELDKNKVHGKNSVLIVSIGLLTDFCKNIKMNRVTCSTSTLFRSGTEKSFMRIAAR